MSDAGDIATNQDIETADLAWLEERLEEYRIELEPTGENGLDETSYIQCELLRSISRKRLVHHLGVIDVDTSLRVASVVKTLLSH